MTDAELVREEEEDAIRQQQEVRKVQGNSTMDIHCNLCIEEQTRCKIKMLRYDMVREMDQRLFSAEDIQANESEYKANLRQLRQLRTKLSTISLAMRSYKASKPSEAALVMEKLAKEEAGTTVNLTAKRLHDAAKAELKQEQQLASVAALQQISQQQQSLAVQFGSISNGSGSLASVAAPFGKCGGGSPYQDASKGGGKGSGGKGTRRQSNYKFRHVDGSTYHADLAGWIAPDPFQFPVDAAFRMDGPNQGIVHTPSDNWPGRCECGQEGHQRSECPANKWTDRDGKTRVNWRWLFANPNGVGKPGNYCDGGGKPQ